MAWLPKSNVVVPVDLSEFSLRALDVARQLVADESHVHVVHVIPPIIPLEPGIIWGDIDDNARRDHAHEIIKKELVEHGAPHAHITVLFGNASHEVAEFARRIHADLIVIHSHGRTGAAHLLMGSVSERIVRIAHCPVLVIRG